MYKNETHNSRKKLTAKYFLRKFRPAVSVGPYPGSSDVQCSVGPLG